jgi:tetratricopeptide (TPR) repeat protein
VTLVLLAQGYMILFFGYVENYSFYALAIGSYLWLSLEYVQGRLPLWPAGCSLVIGLALHLSAATLLPSFVVLAAWGLREKGRRISAARDITITLGALVAVRWILSGLQPGYEILAELVDVGRTALSHEEERLAGYLLSPRHLRDFLNVQFLIGPLAMLLFVPAAIFAFATRSVRDVRGIFFFVVAGSYLAASALAGDSNLGYARNWDLLAPAGIVFCSAGLYFLVRTMPRERLAVLLAFAAVLSLAQLTPWVWINHSQSRSLERFKSLPLGLGRTEIVVGNWYMRQGNPEEAGRWFQRSIEAFPQNVNAYISLGELLARSQQHAAAADAFRKAIDLRPDKLVLYENYALLLHKAGKHEASALVYRRLIEKYPDRPDYQIQLNEVLQAMVDTDEPERSPRRTLAEIEAALRENPNTEALIIEAAMILTELGRNEEALERFRQALLINPDNPGALFATGQLLMKMDRTDEARWLFENFLKLYPDHQLAKQVRGLLGR